MSISRKIALRRYRISDKNAAAQKRYLASEKGRAGAKARQAKYCAANREKRNAKRAVAHAVKTGRLPPALSLKCNRCDSIAGHYHHNSYARDKRLDVEPLCTKCHATHHNAIQAPDGTLRGWVRQKVVRHLPVPDRFSRSGYKGIIVLVLECGHWRTIRGSAVVPRTARCRACANQHPAWAPEAGI